MTQTLEAPQRERWTWKDTVLPLSLGLMGTAALVLWHFSSWQHYMHLTPPATDGGTHAHHGPATGNDLAMMLALFSLAWLLMTVAHMLPTAIPLFTAFRGVARHRSSDIKLPSSLIAGFLSVWTAAGIAVSFIHVHLIYLLETNAAQALVPWLLTATLAAAAVYQFSGYVAKCLTACRSPFSFIAKHWRGADRAARQSFLIGAEYGLSCLGCCAALMVVMFAVGSASHLWMVLFALLSVIQKTVTWGHRLTRPIGAGFGVAAVILAGTQLV